MSEEKADEIIVKSIGICPMDKDDKHSCVVLCYAFSDYIKFINIPYPKNKYDYQDLINVIKSVENVKKVQYSFSNGENRQIFICRKRDGKVNDIIERDYINNRFCGDFSQIVSSKLKFGISNELKQEKNYKTYSVEISPNINGQDDDAYKYTVLNAYNACLLGKVFFSEEFDMETKYGKHIKVEVRVDKSSYDESLLNITPVYNSISGIVDYYETEKFSYIDGKSNIEKTYQIFYFSRIKDYEIRRV